MNLNHISVEARTRSPWEALDLGLVMCQRWWWPLFLSWLIPASCMFVLASIICITFLPYYWLPGIIVWWLKPLWDRGPLYIASRQLFGETVSLRETLLKLPELYKTDWFLWLTWRRLSPTRSFDMPLTVLEKINGKQRTSRQSALHRKHSGAAIWQTFCGIFFEAIFPTAIGAMLFFMLPESLEISPLAIIFEEDDMSNILLELLGVISMALMGTVYSLAGFALYISRRIELEAWDIEISFRHLAATLSNKSQPTLNSTGAKNKTSSNTPTSATSKVISSLLLCLAIFTTATLLPSPAFSADKLDERTQNSRTQVTGIDSGTSTQSSANALNVKNQIIEVLDDDVFHQIETERGWRLKDTESDGYPEWIVYIIDGFIWLGEKLSFIGKFFSWISPFMEAILWVLGLSFVAFAIYHYSKAIKGYNDKKANAANLDAPTVLFGLEVSRSSLPDDIPQTVNKLWQKQDFRAAISLLYRAMLSGMIHQHGFRFLDGHTEGECVNIVKQRGNKELSEYSQQLTQCWQQIAYGHLLPETATVELLCARWGGIFPDE